jgi:hypothetical protein
MNLTTLATSCKWNHTVFVFLFFSFLSYIDKSEISQWTKAFLFVCFACILPKVTVESWVTLPFILMP